MTSKTINIATILVMIGVVSLITVPLTNAEAKSTNTHSTPKFLKSNSPAKLLKKADNAPEAKGKQCVKGQVTMLNNKKSQVCVNQSSVPRYTAIGWKVFGNTTISTPLIVYTNNDQYKANETVNITISNNGTAKLFPQGWGYSITGPNGQHYAPSGVLKMMLVALVPGNSVHWSWDQKDANGTQVAPGKYTVTASYNEEKTNKPMSATKQITILK